MELIVALVAVLLVAVLAGTALLVRGRSGAALPPAPRPGVDYAPGTGDDAEVPRDTPTRTVDVLQLPEPEPELQPEPEPQPEPQPEPELEPELDRPAPSAGRLVRLRDRLARSQSGLGRGLFVLLSRDALDESTWEEVEDTLLTSDMGVAATTELVERLRTRVRVEGAREAVALRALLREELLAMVGQRTDRSLATARHPDGRPAVVLMVGVNGVGKTTTCGKLGRALVGDGRSVVLGAADTFRAAAADQLQTWGARVGAPVVRGPEGGDPASVAFDAVARGIAVGADTVLIDTAGRLHTKTGLMDELGKVKRVVAKHGPVDETLLVLDATTGQNGVVQARVFTEVVDVTGIVLTKLDGSAKGGVVVAVQRELGLPVKLVGLGEGPDDLAPFDAEAFVDALLDGAGG